jgi:hypothetical protein
VGLADDPACSGCLFVDYLSTLPIVRLYIMWMDDRQIGKDLEGNGHGLFTISDLPADI